MSLPDSMQAMVLQKPGAGLRLKSIPLPVPQSSQLLIKVIACVVCPTDLHILVHILIQVAQSRQQHIYAFTKAGDHDTQ